MSDIQNEVQLHPKLQQLVSMFYLRSATSLTYEADGANQIVFHDKRFPDMDQRYRRTHLGSVTMVHDGDGDRNTFKIMSRLIKNERYRESSWDYHTKKTKSIDKALKAMLDFVRPYSIGEVRDDSASTFLGSIEKWVDNAVRKYSSLRVDRHGDLVEEVMHLQALGVQFKTESFRKLAERVGEVTDEYKRRKYAKFCGYHVLVTQSMIYVTKGNIEKTGYGFKFAPVDVGAKNYRSENELPDNILSNIGLLKMVPMKQAVDEVGMRVNDYEFYTLEKVDSFNS